MSESSIAYKPSRQARSEFIEVRGIRLHTLQWGEPNKPKLFMFHGWMDVGASFQFIVDQLSNDWHVIAPDWRGFGKSDWPVAEGRARSYWFADYLADLDCLLDELSPNEPVRLVGHSMGANLVMLYAGIRPERVQSVVNIEGFGLPDSKAASAPVKYRKWLDALKQRDGLRPYGGVEEVAKRLQKNNYRLEADKALFLANHWGAEQADGSWAILGDPAHKIPSPIPYRLAEAQAIWAQIEAPVLHIEAKQTEAALWMFPAGGADASFDALRERFSVIKHWQVLLVDNAGHMVHHDKPLELAKAIEGHVR